LLVDFHLIYAIILKMPDVSYTHSGYVPCLKVQISAYVEYFSQFTIDSEQFPEDIAQVTYLVQ
jgi:hypothetical protein